MTKCAIWARVSSSEQTTTNQLAELRKWAADRGLTVAEEFVTEDSAWTKGNGNGKGADFDKKRNELLEGARLGRYSVVLVWGLDRISRRGSEDMLSFARRLTDTGCRLWSLKDSWVESTADPMIRELLFGVFATIARFESERRSQRVKSAMARPEVQAKLSDRKSRGADKKSTKRDSEGYKRAWTPERRAALAERNRQRANAGG
jgi:DNA invertase Pin-like site-specific DNA recombinase